MGIAPGAEQTQGVAGGQGDASGFQPATLAGKVGKFDHAVGMCGQVKAGRRLLREGEFEGAPFVCTRVIYVQAEAGCFTDKDGFAAQWRNAQGDQVAEGMHHADQTQPGQQEYQRMTETEVVVDCAE